MNFQVTNALMSRAVFHTGAGAFGLASTVFAVGALGGALLAARRGRPTMRLLFATSFAFSVLEILTGADAGLLDVPAGADPDRADAADVDHGRELEHAARHHAEMRGRVMGLYMLVFLGGTPLGSPLAGWVAEEFGAADEHDLRRRHLGGRPPWWSACMLARRRGVQVRDLPASPPSWRGWA